MLRFAILIFKVVPHLLPCLARERVARFRKGLPGAARSRLQPHTDESRGAAGEARHHLPGDLRDGRAEDVPPGFRAAILYMQNIFLKNTF